MSETSPPPPPQRFPDGSTDVHAFTRNVTSWFHQTYYFFKEQTWCNTFWMGFPVHKSPNDLWVYQEIIHQTRPTLILETGTAFGGSALYLAQVGEHAGRPRVVTVDLTNARPKNPLPAHPNITYLAGSSTNPAVVEAMRSHVRPTDRVMVILDSDHSAAHVRAELELYAPLVTLGCYLIVEDTNVNGHPVYPLHGPGPMEALAEFLPAHPEFEVDPAREKFMLTFNPGGYLRRK